ncbi:spore coat U domain-containing protein [Enterobacter ludwigii]
MKLNKILVGLSMAFMLASAQNATAGNEERQFNVSVSITSYCEVGAPNDVDFSSMSAGQLGDQVQSTSLSVQCNDQSPVTISLKPSNNNMEGIGQMTSSAHSQTITYTLSKDQSGFDAWGSGSWAYTPIADGQENQYPIYVRIPNGELNKPSGDYTDNVIVSVDF